MIPDTTVSPFRTIALVGLGLIGGSLIRLVRHQMPETTLIGIDPSVEAREQALTEGIVNTALSSLEELDLATVDLVVLATHVSLNARLLQQIADQATAPVQVMDLGSTKVSICDFADSLPEHVAFIGGHPLAGREVSGFANSRWDLFLNKRFILCPSRRTTPLLQADVHQWLTDLGVVPIEANRHDHDRLMSLVSHFPQLYAVALANLLDQNQPEEALHFLGGGIDDQMRLMASPHDMWGDIYQDNKAQVNAVLTDFIDILQGMQQALMADDLSRWFATSHDIYARYQANKGHSTLS